MTRSGEIFQPLKRSDVRPDALGVLDPGEEVKWFEVPPGKKLVPAILVIIAISAGSFCQEGDLDDPEELVEGVPASALLVMVLFFVVLIGGFDGVRFCHRAGSSLMGFGGIPLAVISRQWWLTRDDLNL